MTRHPRNLDPRSLELLCDHALVGLDAAEEAELARLLGDAGPDRGAELAAAAIDLALSPPATEQLPARVMRSVLGDAVAHFAPTRAQPVSAPASNVVPIAAPRRSPLPWLAAAACFALFAGTLIYALSAPTPRAFAPQKNAPAPQLLRARADDAAAERQALISRGARVLAWSATKDPAAQGASGDVVWSAEEQRGFMRFRGLAANDRKATQYQLWIFDKAQDARYPVDGGVFDVDARTGDVVVAITPKLRVVDPTLFAVTVERPGGVVVSSRERIVVTAGASSSAQELRLTAASRRGDLGSLYDCGS